MPSDLTPVNGIPTLELQADLNDFIARTPIQPQGTPHPERSQAGQHGSYSLEGTRTRLGLYEMGNKANLRRLLSARHTFLRFLLMQLTYSLKG